MKLKKIFIVFFLFCFSLQIFSQTPQIDSLRKVVSVSKIDSTKINSLNELGNSLMRYNLQNAIDTLDLAINLAKQASYEQGLSMAYRYRGFTYFYLGQTDSTIAYFNKSLDLFLKIGNTAEAGKMYNNIGVVNKRLGNLKEAMTSFEAAIKLLEKTNDKRSLLSSCVNLSNIFINIGNFEQALEYNFKALDIFDKIPDKTSKDSLLYGHIYKAIANTYVKTKNYQESNDNYLKALKIYQKLNSTNDIGDIYLNIGYLFNAQDNHSQAIVNYLKALEYYSDDDKLALANYNIGGVYLIQNNFDSAKIFLDSALFYYTKIGDKRGVALVNSSYSDAYNAMGNYTKAIYYGKIALDTAEVIGDISLKGQSVKALGEAYKHLGDYKKALEMFEIYETIQDSLYNSNKQKKITQLSLTYEFEKQKEKAELKYNEEIKRQKIIKNFSFVILFLSLLALLAVFSALRTKKRKNEELQKKNAEILQQKEEIEAQRDEIEVQMLEIENQKRRIEEQAKEIEIQRDLAMKRGDELEQKNRDIEASIHYALRIQKAILPNIDIFNEFFADYFIFNKPRDIVSGDFYWAARKNGKIIVVAADCTGHGVPGAFMSMLGIAFLNQIVSEIDKLESNLILNKLREILIKSLKQKFDDDTTTRDGMDMSLIIFDKENMELEYSGAYNSAYIVTDEVNESLENQENIRIFEIETVNKKIIELRADRMPIGIYILKQASFCRKVIKIKKNDKIYLFSDGYPDLYNKKLNSKFTSKRFKTLLLENNNKTMSEQIDILDATYKNWVGDDKQIDDILVIGLHI
jgi:tetratricopeptide (TPR) repeat protein